MFNELTPDGELIIRPGAVVSYELWPPEDSGITLLLEHFPDEFSFIRDLFSSAWLGAVDDEWDIFLRDKKESRYLNSLSDELVSSILTNFTEELLYKCIGKDNKHIIKTLDLLYESFQWIAVVHGKDIRKPGWVMACAVPHRDEEDPSIKSLLIIFRDLFKRCDGWNVLYVACKLGLAPFIKKLIDDYQFDIYEYCGVGSRQGLPPLPLYIVLSNSGYWYHSDLRISSGHLECVKLLIKYHLKKDPDTDFKESLDIITETPSEMDKLFTKDIKQFMNEIKAQLFGLDRLYGSGRPGVQPTPIETEFREIWNAVLQ